MPTYEYRCKACGHELEAVQAFTDDPLTECPSCGAAQLRKVFGAVGISFRGSGFYKTDSRTKTSAGASSSSSSDSSGNGSGNGSSGSSSDSSSSSSSTSSSSTTDAKSA